MLKNFNFSGNLQELFFFIFLYLTLIISFILNENSTGGAIIDYFNQKEISIEFSKDFKNTFFNYDQFSTRHSPVLLIFLSFFEKLNFSDAIIRAIHFHLSLLLPYFFYRTLLIKYSKLDKKILLLLTSLILISPTFRSLSIWPDSRIFGLIFFTISVMNFIQFQKFQKFKYCIYNIITLAISSYISPNFSVFSIFFIIKFILFYKYYTKETAILILLNILLSLPAFYYIVYLDINFFKESAAIGLDQNKNRIFFNNIFNDILITFTLLFFYLIPFLLTKTISIFKIGNIKTIIFSIIIFLLCFINFDYNFKYSGGGIFLQISNLIFLNNYFFYLIAFLSILIIFPLIFRDKFNTLLFFLILLNNPQYTIYHKYFDPFLIISYFTIFSFNIQINELRKNQNFLIVFFFFLIFLIISVFKHLWKI